MPASDYLGYCRIMFASAHLNSPRFLCSLCIQLFCFFVRPNNSCWSQNNFHGWKANFHGPKTTWMNWKAPRVPHFATLDQLTNECHNRECMNSCTESLCLGLEWRLWWRESFGQHARNGTQSQLQIRLISYPHTHPGNKFDIQFIQFPHCQHRTGVKVYSGLIWHRNKLIFGQEWEQESGPGSQRMENWQSDLPRVHSLGCVADSGCQSKWQNNWNRIHKLHFFYISEESGTPTYMYSILHSLQSSNRAIEQSQIQFYYRLVWFTISTILAWNGASESQTWLVSGFSLECQMRGNKNSRANEINWLVEAWRCAINSKVSGEESCSH